MTPKTSSLDQGSNAVQLLSALPTNTTEASRSGNFGQVLENSMQPRPAERSRTPKPGAERAPEAQTQRAEDRTSRPAADRPPPRSEQGQDARSGEPEAKTSEPAPQTHHAETHHAETGGNPEPRGDASGKPTEHQDPAKLAVLAAIIAALRGNATTPETDGDAPLPSVRATHGTTTSTLASDAEGRPGGHRSAEAQTTSTAPKLAAANTSANSANSADTARPAASLRTPELASALSSAAMPARNALNQAGTAENPANLPSTAPIGGIRAEPAVLQKMLVPTPAGQRMWADDVANRVIWMAGRGEGRAELVLTPPNLGKLGISIQMNGEQTTAHFVAASAAAREALEQALPRLREALQQAGITLGEASVSTSGDQQARNGGEGAPNGGNRAQSDDYGILPGMVELENDGRWTQVGNNLVDTFA